MSNRLRMGKVYPAGYQAMIAFDKVIGQTGIDPWHKELIKIRASQINGCAYCVDQHTQDALALGVNPRKINVLCTWREATNHFSEEEQLIIRLTEEMTLIHEHGVSDELYDQCIAKFGDARTGELMMAVIVINAWNRLGVGQHLHPEFA